MSIDHETLNLVVFKLQKIQKNWDSLGNTRDFVWRREKVKLWCAKIFRRFEKGYHAIALQTEASLTKDHVFDMYGTSHEMFGLQVDCIVISSIVVDFFS